jgi:hypothetical protein
MMHIQKGALEGASRADRPLTCRCYFLRVHFDADAETLFSVRAVAAPQSLQFDTRSSRCNPTGVFLDAFPVQKKDLGRNLLPLLSTEQPHWGLQCH